MELLVLVEAPGQLLGKLGDVEVGRTGVDADGERARHLVEGPPGTRVLDEVATGAVFLPVVGEGTRNLASQGVALGQALGAVVPHATAQLPATIVGVAVGERVIETDIGGRRTIRNGQDVVLAKDDCDEALATLEHICKVGGPSPCSTWKC